MSRTKRGSKATGHEYWGRRSAAAKSGRCPGRDTKRATNRAERRQGKRTTDE